MSFNDLLEEQEFCGYIEDVRVRNRSVANLKGIKAALQFFKNCGLNCHANYAVHNIKKLFEELDIADIYIDSIRIDVRLSLSPEKFIIPKKHYEYNITPDLYMLVYYDTDSGKTEIAGFIPPDDIDKSNYDDYYYIIKRNTITPASSTAELFDSLNAKSKNNLPLNAKKKILLYLDNLLVDTKEYYQEFVNCVKFRELYVDYISESDILAQGNFDFTNLNTSESPLEDIVDTEIEPVIQDKNSSIGSVSDKSTADKLDEIDLGFADGLEVLAEQNDVMDLSDFISDSTNSAEVQDAKPDDVTDILDIMVPDIINSEDSVNKINSEQYKEIEEILPNEMEPESTQPIEPPLDEDGISLDLVVDNQDETNAVEIPNFADVNNVFETANSESVYVESQEEMIIPEDSVDLVENESKSLDESMRSDNSLLEENDVHEELPETDILDEVNVLVIEEPSDDTLLENNKVQEELPETGIWDEVKDLKIEEPSDDTLLVENEVQEELPETDTSDEVNGLEIEEPSDDTLLVENEVQEELPETDISDEVNGLEIEEPSDDTLLENNEVQEELDVISEINEIEDLNQDMSIDSEGLDEISAASPYNEEVYKLDNILTEPDDELIEIDNHDSEMSFSDFANDIQQIEQKKDSSDIGEEEENSENQKTDFDKYDNLDKNYIPDFASGEFRLEGESKIDEQVATSPVQSIENKNETQSIDIQAAMEGFVNTLEPDDSMSVQHPDEIQTLNDVINEDAELEAISETIEEPEGMPQENEVVQQEPLQDTVVVKNELKELYDENKEPELDTSIPYKKHKKKQKSGGAAKALVLIVLAAAGTFGYLFKDSILEKFNGSEVVESVPNELAAPIDNTIAQQSKEKPVETDTQAMLNDIEEPVQLLDSSVSISALTVDCDVPSILVNNHSRRYLIKLAKRSQLQLRNALLIAGEQPLANKIIIDLNVDKDILSYVKISGSSGSKKVDAIASATITEILKDTQPYAGTFGKNKGNIKLIVKF